MYGYYCSKLEPAMPEKPFFCHFVIFMNPYKIDPKSKRGQISNAECIIHKVSTES